jgi:hypothetical protein
VRAERGADARVELERLVISLEPARLGHGVLREEADQLAARALGREVPGAPVAELLRGDLDQLRARRERTLG